MAFWVDRERELGNLENEYRKPGFSLVLISGRRRIGKTALVRRFLKGKPGFYFEADRTTFKLNLWRLVEDLSEFAGTPVPEPDLKNFKFLLFRLVDEHERRGRKFILAIDEFPRLTQRGGFWTEEDRRKFPSFDSVLQRLIDEGLGERDVMLILLGSSASLMREIFHHGSAPLYGRSTLNLFLKPLPVEAVAEFFGLDPEDPHCRKALFHIWTVFGGVPHFLSLLRAELHVQEGDLDKALRRLLLETSTLKEEPRLVFQDEAVSAEALSSIVLILRDKELALPKISQLSGVRDIFPCMEVLQVSGLAEPVLQLAAPGKTDEDAPWRLIDPFLRLSTKLGKNLFSEADDAEAEWELLADSLLPLMGRTYEVLWQSIVAKSLAKSFRGVSFGRFLLHDPEEKKTFEFDGVAFKKEGRKKEVLFVFEAKARFRPDDLLEFEEKLKKLGRRFPLGRGAFVLFASADPLEDIKTLLDLPIFWASYPTGSVLGSLKEKIFGKVLRRKARSIVLSSFKP